MRTISAIMPVYNEEFLIKPCLEHLSPYVDQIVVVDGSPEGISTDNTAEIAKGFEKVKYLSGEFRTIPGAWDAGSQKNIAISEAIGDVLLFVSADMFLYNLQFLCNTIRSEENARVFFCLTVEFWIDSSHARMYGAVDNLTIPSFPQEAVAIAREAQPVAGQHGNLETIAIKPKDQVLITNTIKYHLGWIRPFKSQTTKHLRHIRQGRWGEEGSRLLSGTEAKLEQWAILHVLSYKQVPCVELRHDVPDEWQFMKNMNYLDGQEAVIKEYQNKYGTSPFRGVK